MQKLQRAVRRERRLQLAASAALLAFGVALTWFCFTRSAIVTILGLVFTVVGIRFVSHFTRAGRVEDDRLFRQLLDHPEQIVWVYSVVTQRLPFGFRFSQNGVLYLKLIDGDEHSVSLPPADLKLVSHFLNRLLPHATFGYTRDREQWFLADPRMLLRE